MEADQPSTRTATPPSCPTRSLLGPGQADPGRVPGGAVHHRERRIQRAAGGAAGSQKLDVGYLPTTDAPNKPANAAVGANPVNGYTLAPLYQWEINYFPLNFQSTTGNGPVIRQLYFRQALQYLMNQKAVIDGPLHGYGPYTVGPVGTYPQTSYLSPRGQQGDPFPFNPAKAKSLLTSHGWKVAPNGVTTCQTPSLCGPGIAQGHQLVFNLPYATGTNWIASR